MHENETVSSLVNRSTSLETQLLQVQAYVPEDDLIAVLLKSLPTPFHQIVTRLKEKDPLPTLESTINSLQEEERVQSGSSQLSEQVYTPALVVQQNTRSFSNNNFKGSKGRYVVVEYSISNDANSQYLSETKL
ncbi:hypothetical protein L7F22_056047 [Adiantum nelumboides]|nr:hypothetical protein [Adiantum nelumboides]